jgi:Skp family chaperone for outer membrane proteins
VKKNRYTIVMTLAAMLAGCAAHSQIGLVDVQRIVNNWPEYQGYQNQLVSEERSIASRRESAGRRVRDAAALQRKYTKITDQLSQQIRDAAGKIAAKNQMKLVLTREGVGYGGTDITSDIEKSMNITEKATPTPGV